MKGNVFSKLKDPIIPCRLCALTKKKKIDNCRQLVAKCTNSCTLKEN